mmetsp:Transcript_67597/g.140910  ORF Transcript_67597/g.140910 Transcript_67597/m.140910 type:complete len:144 (-) Transcript_67597:91-522(-)
MCRLFTVRKNHNKKGFNEHKMFCRSLVFNPYFNLALDAGEITGVWPEKLKSEIVCQGGRFATSLFQFPDPITFGRRARCSRQAKSNACVAQMLLSVVLVDIRSCEEEKREADTWLKRPVFGFCEKRKRARNLLRETTNTCQQQ